MSEIRFEVKDDALIRYTFGAEMGESTCKLEVVLTKKIFQECYEKWIKPQETQEEKSCNNCNLNNTKACQPATCTLIGPDGHGLWERAESEE
jgi:hypothetical protein